MPSVVEHLKSLWEYNKERYPNSVVIMRIGEFYEAYGEDAKIVSEICDVVYCSRKFGDERLPMAGFPAFASEAYIADVRAVGHRVVVMDKLREADDGS